MLPRPRPTGGATGPSRDGPGGGTHVIDLKPPCRALGTWLMRGAWFWGARESVGGAARSTAENRASQWILRDEHSVLGGGWGRRQQVGRPVPAKDPVPGSERVAFWCRRAVTGVWEPSGHHTGLSNSFSEEQKGL